MKKILSVILSLIVLLELIMTVDFSAFANDVYYGSDIELGMNTYHNQPGIFQGDDSDGMPSCVNGFYSSKFYYHAKEECVLKIKDDCDLNVYGDNVVHSLSNHEGFCYVYLNSNDYFYVTKSSDSEHGSEKFYLDVELLPDNSVIEINSVCYKFNTINKTATVTTNQKNYKQYIIPEKIWGYDVVGIDNYAFKGCDSFSEITIPKSVKTIGSYAFANCVYLQSVTVMNPYIKYDDEPFIGCIKKLNIKGYTNSTTESFAKNKGFVFESIGYSDPCKHNYKSTTKQATPTKNGNIIKVCQNCGDTVSSVIYYPKTISLSSSKYTYNSKVKTPSLTVKDSKGKTLTNKKDYDVVYSSGRKNVGKYYATVKFKGNYTGTVKKSFTIVPKGTSIIKLSPTKRGFKANWKKQSTQTTGYQIQLSTSKNFKKNARIITIKKNGTLSNTIKNLSSRKRYYVRIRTYKTVSKTNYYSSWSSYKYVTTK